MKRGRDTDELGAIDAARHDILRAYSQTVLTGLEADDVILACTFIVRLPLERSFRRKEEREKYGRIFKKYGSPLIRVLCDYIEKSTKEKVENIKEGKGDAVAFEINDVYKKSCYLLAAIADNRFISHEDTLFVEELLRKYNKSRDKHIKTTKANTNALREMIDEIQDSFRAVADRIGVTTESPPEKGNEAAIKQVQDIIREVISGSVLERVNRDVESGRHTSYYAAFVEAIKDGPAPSPIREVFLATLELTRGAVNDFFASGTATTPEET